VFDDKTIAAFEAVNDKLSYHPGTVKLITLITNWFKMMNVKDRYDDIRLRDVKRAPWKIDCNSFKKLHMSVGSTYWWEGTVKICRKLTIFTADAFVVTTKLNIAAATDLLTNQHFQYVLHFLKRIENVLKSAPSTFQYVSIRNHLRCSLARQDSELVDTFT